MGLQLAMESMERGGRHYEDSALVVSLPGPTFRGTLAHEIRHAKFRELSKKGKTTIFSGDANERLDELFTYPMSIRLSTESSRAIYLEVYQNRILKSFGNYLTGAKESYSEVFNSGDSKVLSDSGQYFELRSGSSVLSVMPIKIGEQPFVKVYLAKEGVGISLEFASTDSAAYIQRIKENIARMLEGQVTEESANGLANFQSRIADRLNRIETIVSDATAITGRMEANIRNEKNNTEEASNLMNLVRRHLIIEEPLD
ncbi:MAG: hypothetical protein V4736_14960 [Bdellovibrionota bacterium]